MEIKINIPDNFVNDYIGDKFKDFFSRVIADIDNKGMCGNYEKEIADMFIEAFDNSKDLSEINTNADRIRNMSDEELAEWIHNMCDFEKDEEPYKSIYNLDTEKEEEIHDSYGDLLKWLQSEAEQEIT